MFRRFLVVPLVACAVVALGGLIVKSTADTPPTSDPTVIDAAQSFEVDTGSVFGSLFGPAHVSGAWMVVGASRDQSLDAPGTNVPGDNGAVEVLHYTDTGWSYFQTLTEPLMAQPAARYFGGEVSISGTRIVAGGLDAYSNVQTVDVYDLVDGSWTRTASLSPALPISGVWSFTNVAVDGDTIAALAQPVDGWGSLLIFTRDATGTWQQAASFSGIATGDGLAATSAGFYTMNGPYGEARLFAFSSAAGWIETDHGFPTASVQGCQNAHLSSQDDVLVAGCGTRLVVDGVDPVTGQLSLEADIEASGTADQIGGSVDTDGSTVVFTDESGLSVRRLQRTDSGQWIESNAFHSTDYASGVVALGDTFGVIRPGSDGGYGTMAIVDAAGPTVVQTLNEADGAYTEFGVKTAINAAAGLAVATSYPPGGPAIWFSRRLAGEWSAFQRLPIPDGLHPAGPVSVTDSGAIEIPLYQGWVDATTLSEPVLLSMSQNDDGSWTNSTTDWISARGPGVAATAVASTVAGYTPIYENENGVYNFGGVIAPDGAYQELTCQGLPGYTGWDPCGQIQALSPDGSRLAIVDENIGQGPNGGGTGHGGIVVYQRTAQGQWNLQGTIVAPDGQTLSGASLTFTDSDSLVVGAPYPNGGFVAFYAFDGSAWQLTTQAATSAANDQLGSSVSYDPRTGLVLVGEPSPSPDGLEPGTGGDVRVYQRSASGAWLQTATVKPTGLQSEDSFGNSVSADGGLVLAGAFLADGPAGRDVGKVYLSSLGSAAAPTLNVVAINGDPTITTAQPGDVVTLVGNNYDPNNPPTSIQLCDSSGNCQTVQLENVVVDSSGQLRCTVVVPTSSTGGGGTETGGGTTNSGGFASTTVGSLTIATGPHLYLSPDHGLPGALTTVGVDYLGPNEQVWVTPYASTDATGPALAGRLAATADPCGCLTVAFTVPAGTRSIAAVDAATGEVRAFNLWHPDDITPPVVVGTLSSAPNVAGWFRSPPTITWTATDPDNAPSTLTVPPPTVASTEGLDVSYTSGASCDPAGNCATGTAQVSLDTTPPTTGVPTLSTNPMPVSGTTTISAAVSDTLSGVVGAEYFIGTDPGVGRGSAMTVSAGTATATVPVNSLNPGVYPVGVRSLDAAGNWSSTSETLLVVYDPTGGFATGGGWIIPGSQTSDPGDTLPGLDGTSKANFGFVVKYQNGASTVPGGNLQFDYNVGNFHLHSTAMDWLVVTNKSQAQFQGNASIQGSTASYPFTVQARDGDVTGQPDRFVIKIYPAGSNPSTASPIYKASGDVQGQITIHTS